MVISNIQVVDHLRRTLFASCILVGVISAPANSAFGQAATPPTTTKKSAPAENTSADSERRFNVFALDHADAGRIREMIEPLVVQIDKSATILEDSQTNRLIVRADANAMLAMESLLKILDTPTDKRADQQLKTKFIRLQSGLHGEMRDAMQLFLSGMGRMSIDPKHNLVIVQDTSESLAKFEQALEQYDVIRRETMEMQQRVQRGSTVRIVWLINGVRDNSLAVPPADLKDIVTDLARLGVEDLRLAAQAIVKTTDGQHFQIRCSPEVGNPCEFAVEGALGGNEGDIDILNIQVTATETVPAPDGKSAEMKRLCELDATVRAPHGHTVVLGVAPTDKKTSVFVVQVKE